MNIIWRCIHLLKSTYVSVFIPPELKFHSICITFDFFSASSSTFYIETCLLDPAQTQLRQYTELLLLSQLSLILQNLWRIRWFSEYRKKWSRINKNNNNLLQFTVFKNIFFWKKKKKNFFSTTVKYMEKKIQSQELLLQKVAQDCGTMKLYLLIYNVCAQLLHSFFKARNSYKPLYII